MTTGRINQVTTVRPHNSTLGQATWTTTITRKYEWRRFKGTITPKWLGDIHLKPVGPCVFTTTAQQASRALSKRDRQLAPCGSIVTVLEPTSRNTNTQGHTSSIASKTLGKRAAATHKSHRQTRGFRHKSDSSVRAS